MDNKKIEAKRRREEQALNRVLIWFGGAVVFVLYILMINRFYVNHSTGSQVQAYQFGQLLIWVGFALAACAAGFAVWLYLCRRDDRAVLVPVIGTVAAAALSGSTFIALHWYGKGVQLLLALGIIAAVLAMIYYLYQREFFIIAALSGGGLLCLWLFRIVNHQRMLVYLSFAVLGAATLAVAVLARMLQQKKGVATIFGKKRRILSKKCVYPMVYAGCGIAAAALIATLVIGAVAAYYMMFVLVAWLFIVAVYFTVKLV